MTGKKESLLRVRRDQEVQQDPRRIQPGEAAAAVYEAASRIEKLTHTKGKKEKEKAQ
jgi:hypothetical protein